MQFKGRTLLVWFIVFYTLVHLIRHIPDLAQGRLDWNGEKTYTLSFIRIAADMLLSWLFTLSAYALLFRCYPGKRYGLLTAGLLLSLFVCYLAGFLWTRLMETVPVRLSDYLPFAVLFYSMDTVFGAAYYFVRFAYQRELLDKEMELQHRRSELSFLRSQLNPHFLFNQLNTIYSLVYESSPAALEAIDGLSTLLRYTLYDGDVEVPLTKEVEAIKQFIHLQQLRFEYPFAIDFDLTGDPGQTLIAPLLLIPFVENAFKHGDVSAPGWLAISLAIQDQRILFSCRNKIALHHKDQQGGIGIANVSRRLELLYPSKHRLVVSEQKGWFHVEMELYGLN